MVWANLPTLTSTSFREMSTLSCLKYLRSVLVVATALCFFAPVSDANVSGDNIYNKSELFVERLIKGNLVEREFLHCYSDIFFYDDIQSTNCMCRCYAGSII